MNELSTIAQTVANGRQWWSWARMTSGDEQRGRNKLDVWRVGVKINTFTMLTPINLSVAIVFEEASVWKVVGFGNMKITAWVCNDAGNGIVLISATN